MITPDTLKSKTSLPPLLKVREVAKVLSLSRASVHALIESGDLDGQSLNPSRKKVIRRHVRITRKSLAAFFRRRFGHDLDHALQNTFQN